MTNSDDHFFSVECFFYSENKDWAKNYLYNKNYRITEMVHSVLNDEYLNSYGFALRNYFEKELLILRAKIYNQNENAICLFQIWKNHISYDSFLKEIEGKKFETAIRSTGIRFDKKITKSVSQDLLHKKVEQIRSKEVLWQFVNNLFKKEWMIIGDPIREGKKKI